MSEVANTATQGRASSLDTGSPNGPGYANDTLGIALDAYKKGNANRLSGRKPNIVTQTRNSRPMTNGEHDRVLEKIKAQPGFVLPEIQAEKEPEGNLEFILIGGPVFDAVVDTLMGIDDALSHVASWPLRQWGADAAKTKKSQTCSADGQCDTAPVEPISLKEFTQALKKEGFQIRLSASLKRRMEKADPNLVGVTFALNDLGHSKKALHEKHSKIANKYIRPGKPGQPGDKFYVEQYPIESPNSSLRDPMKAKHSCYGLPVASLETYEEAPCVGMDDEKARGEELTTVQQRVVQTMQTLTNKLGDAGVKEALAFNTPEAYGTRAPKLEAAYNAAPPQVRKKLEKDFLAFQSARLQFNTLMSQPAQRQDEAVNAHLLAHIKQHQQQEHNNWYEWGCEHWAEILEPLLSEENGIDAVVISDTKELKAWFEKGDKRFDPKKWK
jgi:hypothetical protein